MAEKVAWRAARGRDLKLVTVCPALVTGPGFRRRNSTPSIAYLKGLCLQRPVYLFEWEIDVHRTDESVFCFIWMTLGAHAMLAEGLLATADVERVAEAHVRVYEAMNGTAGGRYICYDHVVRRAEEFAELERQLGLRPRGTSPPPHRGDTAASSELCKRKLARLVSSRRRCTHDPYLPVAYD